MIAEAILRTMDSVQAKLIGQSAATTTLIGCPVPTGPASHTGEHDQCYSDTTQPDQTTFAVAAADAAIKTYCLKHQSQTVTAGNGIMDQVPNGADASTSLILQASLDTESACVNYPNLGQWNYFDCSNNLGSAMNDCQSSRPFALPRFKDRPTLIFHRRPVHHDPKKRRKPNSRLHHLQHPRLNFGNLRPRHLLLPPDRNGRLQHGPKPKPLRHRHHVRRRQKRHRPDRGQFQ